MFFKKYYVSRHAAFFVSMDLEMDGLGYLTPTILMVRRIDEMYLKLYYYCRNIVSHRQGRK